MWLLWDLSSANVNIMRAELGIANVNFKRAEHFKCEFYESWALWMQIYENWALQMWILWEPSFVNVNLWELSFANVNFMRAKLCESEIYESSNSILDVYLWAELCACEFHENWALGICNIWELSWVLWLSILWELNIVNRILMRPALRLWMFIL